MSSGYPGSIKKNVFRLKDYRNDGMNRIIPGIISADYTDFVDFNRKQ